MGGESGGLTSVYIEIETAEYMISDLPVDDSEDT
jgi:hypothetical protein